MPHNFVVGDIVTATMRAILFATPVMLNLLRNAKTWYCDGTFKIVRQPFTQLFSVHVFIRAGDTVKQVPVMFVLMSRRRAKDYRKVFRAIRDICDGHQMTCVVTDFEKGEVTYHIC
jgi:hypothetical protein